MKVYTVGGAVRDFALGFDPKDMDYVIVGATVKEALNNLPHLRADTVGNDFPVFLDTNGNEYAMARKERKVGSGYGGFEVDFDPSVTIEEDLKRRDLSINAMAAEALHPNLRTIKGLVDPYGGMEDLRNKILRPVSDAFMEDPVRVLRMARFRARMGADWKVHESVLPMVATMARNGELASLVADRVQKEMSRALMEPHPRLFFDTLLEIDAIHVVFPALFRLKMTREALRHHPEGDTYEHVGLVLEQARKFATTGNKDFDLSVMYSALLHDIGKSVTPWELQPRHHGHDVAGVPLVEQFAKDYVLPTHIKRRAALVAEHHMKGHNLDEMTPKKVVKWFDSMNILNMPDIAELFLAIFISDEKGRLGSENVVYPFEQLFRQMVADYKSVKFKDVFPEGEKNPNIIKQKMYRARIKAVAKGMKNVGVSE